MKKTCEVNGCNRKTELSFCTACCDIFPQPNQLIGRLGNFISKDERKLHSKMLVGVHWNAHKNVWSIVRMNSRKSVGLVLGYAPFVTLKDVTTHIDKTKQKKVIDSGVKDRHAFLVGYVDSLTYEALEKNIYYNPKQVENFVDADKFIMCEEKKYIGKVSKASLSFNFNKNRPVVTYND